MKEGKHSIIAEKENNFEKELQEMLTAIHPADRRVAEIAKKRWDSIAKPLHSLGKLEKDIIRIAGMTGDPNVHLDKKALLVMCADNGVVEEGVTQTGQEVTAIVAENFLSGNTSAAIMCRQAGVDLFPFDIGMVTDTKIPDVKIRYGTANFVKEPAMTKEEAVHAILSGIQIVRDKKKEGYQILCTGEMGIGNTTTSSAVASVLLGKEPDELTGRGAGLDDSGLQKKIQAIRTGIEKHHPQADDPVDVLAKVGGLDIAGMAGICLGGAIEKIPVVLDGFISDVAALLAVRLCTAVKDYLLISHVSKEPGARMVLQELADGKYGDPDCHNAREKQSVAGITENIRGMNLGMCLGEGTGAVAYLPVLELGLSVYQEMSTFAENQIEDYKDYTKEIPAEDSPEKTNAGGTSCCM